MPIKKYTQSEGSLEILRGEEAQVLNDHFRRVGKSAISEFSKDEKEALESDLAVVRKSPQDDNQTD